MLGQLTGEPMGYEDDVLRDVKKVLDKYYFLNSKSKVPYHWTNIGKCVP
jgi:uncharacterized protein (UPF0248 family)